MPLPILFANKCQIYLYGTDPKDTVAIEPALVWHIFDN